MNIKVKKQNIMLLNIFTSVFTLIILSNIFVLIIFTMNITN